MPPRTLNLRDKAKTSSLKRILLWVLFYNTRKAQSPELSLMIIKLE
jgi:hypothetical protein